MIIALILAGSVASGIILFSANPPKDEINNKIPIPPINPVDQEMDQMLLDAVIEHFEKLEALEVPPLLEDYSQNNPTVIWDGQFAGVFAGKYDGFTNVRILYSQITAITHHLNWTIENYDAEINGDEAKVTFDLELFGNSSVLYNYQFKISATINYVYEDGRWLIQHENWVFTFLKADILASGTVFPLHWRKRGDYSIWDERVQHLINLPDNRNLV